VKKAECKKYLSSSMLFCVRKRGNIRKYTCVCSFVYKKFRESTKKSKGIGKLQETGEKRIEWWED
jgi:hypothetical protein